MKKRIAVTIAKYIDAAANITGAWAEPYNGEWVVVISWKGVYNKRYRTKTELRNDGYDFPIVK